MLTECVKLEDRALFSVVCMAQRLQIGADGRTGSSVSETVAPARATQERVLRLKNTKQKALDNAVVQRSAPMLGMA